MALAIHRLIRQAPLDRAAVDAFLAEHAPCPIVEGPHVTFLWRGEADAVWLQHWIWGLPGAQALHRIDGTDLWYVIVDLPPGSRVEYKLEIVRDGHGEWIRDPRNPLLAADPFGANSVCHGTGYETPEWTRRDPRARPGHIESHVLDGTPLGDGRRVDVYLPARFRWTRRYPLLVVHDGHDYLRYADLKHVLDNLIDRLEVAPLIALLSHPGERLDEYPNHAGHAAFVADHLLRWAQARYPLHDDPRQRCLMGASFGGVASLSTAWRYPGRFGSLLLQSGSFAFSDIGEHRRGPTFDRVVEFVNAFREEPGRPADKVFVSCGMYESLIYENRSMVPLLQATGMEVRYVEARDGHNWQNWRDRLRDALAWLFPGPLWMVYE